MHKITEYVIALCDLLEAEARSLRQASFRAAAGLLVLVLAGLLMATGFGFLIAGLDMLLTAAMNPWAGAMITGGIVLLFGLIVTWIATSIGR